MSSSNRQMNGMLVILLALNLSAALQAQVPAETCAPAPAQAAPRQPVAEQAVPVIQDAQAPSPTPVSQPLPIRSATVSTAGHKTYYAPIAGKKNKTEYVGPKTLVELAPTPMLDEEGRQRLDPEGKPLFNPPLRQQRDKRGNPLFDEDGRAVMQTSADMGYDDKGKKIHVKNVKPPKTISVSIERGILTVDGMPGKAGLNYEIKDLKFIYLYAPWIGTTIVSHSPFAGAMEQKNAFDDRTLTVTVDTHQLQLYSDNRLLGKKPESAFVAVDRGFKLPAQFPVIGYGETLRPPYAWPGSHENAALKGSVAPPALPVNLRPVTLLQPCPPGQMRMPGRTPLPGEKLPPQPCVLIQRALPGVGAPKIADVKPASSSPGSTSPTVIVPTSPAPAPTADAAAPVIAPPATPPNH